MPRRRGGIIVRAIRNANRATVPMTMAKQSFMNFEYMRKRLFSKARRIG